MLHRKAWLQHFQHHAHLCPAGVRIFPHGTAAIRHAMGPQPEKNSIQVFKASGFSLENADMARPSQFIQRGRRIAEVSTTTGGPLETTL
ncbi:hypothetical protein [Hydrogenophaga sp. 5NK40-0174]|uniref:hypothetical protein n=1 Tax=Hydrogenophaga sp. 5NK40-0174 TaxID=3127649 RepID=UPI00334196F1